MLLENFSHDFEIERLTRERRLRSSAPDMADLLPEFFWREILLGCSCVFFLKDSVLRADALAGFLFFPKIDIKIK